MDEKIREKMVGLVASLGLGIHCNGDDDGCFDLAAVRGVSGLIAFR